MTTYTNVVHRKGDVDRMLTWGPNIKIHTVKCRNPSCDSLYKVELKFRWYDYSEASSTTATDPNELPPSAGGEGIGKRTPAVVINNTMSDIHRVPCDALDALSKIGKGGRDKARFASILISSRPCPTKSVPSSQRPARCYP